MNTDKRIELIHLMSMELHDTVSVYNKVKKDKGYSPCAGYGVEKFESKEAIKRRITVLREELLELSKSL